MAIVAFALSLCGVALFVWVAYALHVLRGNVRDLLSEFHNAHPYSDPSAAAVVTEPASGQRVAPAGQLVHARTALRVLEHAPRRMVTVTRDSAPIHTRPTVAESPAPAGPKASADDGTHDRSTNLGGFDRPTPEGEPDTDREPPRAAPLDVAQALGAPPGMVGLSLDESDREQAPEAPLRRSLLTTHPSERGTQLPPAPPDVAPELGPESIPEPPRDETIVPGGFLQWWWGVRIADLIRRRVASSRFRVVAPLTEAELAIVDRMARARGLTRKAMLASLRDTGIAEDERRLPAPTTPPGGPANDAPQASGKRKT